MIMNEILAIHFYACSKFETRRTYILCKKLN